MLKLGDVMGCGLPGPWPRTRRPAQLLSPAAAMPAFARAPVRLAPPTPATRWRFSLFWMPGRLCGLLVPVLAGFMCYYHLSLVQVGQQTPSVGTLPQTRSKHGQTAEQDNTTTAMFGSVQELLRNSSTPGRRVTTSRPTTRSAVQPSKPRRPGTTVVGREWHALALKVVKLALVHSLSK